VSVREFLSELVRRGATLRYALDELVEDFEETSRAEG